MDKALFFPVFVNDYDEVQLITLKRKWGIEGYGVYTFLRTKLQDVDNYEYPTELIPNLAYLAGISEEKLTDIINNSGLFAIGNDYFSCPLLDEALLRHNGIKAKKSEQGKKGGQTRMSTMTFEQKKELSRKGHEARYGKKLQANTDKLPAKNNSAGNLPDNEIDIDIEKEKEKEKEKENDREIESEIENANERNPIPQSSSSFHFSPQEIQDQINRYLNSNSKFFKQDNINITVNVFTEYYREYPNTKIDIFRFEELLYIYLAQSTMSVDVKSLNEHLNTKSISVNTGSIRDLVKMINDNPNVKQQVEKILSEVK